MADYPNDAARVALMLRTGKVILCIPRLLAGEEVPLQKTNPELQVFKYQNLGYVLHADGSAPFNDVRVRRPVPAINRSAC